MNEKNEGKKSRKTDPGRDERLKKALKANMARRKQQARGRAAAQGGATTKKSE